MLQACSCGCRYRWLDDAPPEYWSKVMWQTLLCFIFIVFSRISVLSNDLMFEFTIKRFTQWPSLEPSPWFSSRLHWLYSCVFWERRNGRCCILICPVYSHSSLSTFASGHLSSRCLCASISSTICLLVSSFFYTFDSSARNSLSLLSSDVVCVYLSSATHCSSESHCLIFAALNLKSYCLLLTHAHSLSLALLFLPWRTVGLLVGKVRALPVLLILYLASRFWRWQTYGIER